MMWAPITVYSVTHRARMMSTHWPGLCKSSRRIRVTSYVFAINHYIVTVKQKSDSDVIYHYYEHLLCDSKYLIDETSYPHSPGPLIHSFSLQSYSMDAYFRQTWTDRRLQFNGPVWEMAIHLKMLERIWTPDTFFYNGRASYLHTITTPNKLLRIRQDGTVLYSMR